MPAIPALLQEISQFLIYRKEPKGAGKLNKVPCSYLTGAAASAFDPANWTAAMLAESWASIHGDTYGVGFVLTPESRIAAIDIDGCRHPQTGQLSGIAHTLMALLPGAYVEVSVSGTGLHLWVTYSGAMPPHGSRNAAHGLEFYSADRFIALGEPYPAAGGDGRADHAAVLPTLIAQYFPAGAAVTGETAWTTEPREDWRGPQGDGELIQRMMRANSPGAAFGGRASFADLWEAREEALSRNYPDANGRPYDASVADAALAQHLAFWTGCDCERIRRLMERSALARDKWDRSDYLTRTILGAVGRQEDVLREGFDLGAQKRRQEQIAENLTIGEGSQEYPPASVQSLEEMRDRYVHVIQGKRVVDLKHPRRIFGLDEWKSAHKASRTVLEDKKNFNLDGSNKTKQVETATLWEMDPSRKQVDAVTFWPGKPGVTRDPEGNTAANTWREIERSGPVGDPALFIRHVQYLFAAEANRFLDWLAHIEQFPGVLPHSGWVHVSPMQGTGRNWLAGVLCRLWSGYVANSFDLAEALRTGFNGALSRKLLAIVDEINEGGSEGRWEHAEKLKSLVTSEHRHINPKYGHQRTEYNACRWLIFSNSTTALPLTERDRRFNVVRNDLPPQPPGYYERLYAAQSDPGLINGLAALLRTRDLSAFNPGAHAAMSEAKGEMVAASRSEADEAIADLISHHPADVITTAALGELLTGRPGGQMTAHHRHALDRAGTRAYGKAVRFGPAPKKIRILRNFDLWKDASTAQIQAELTKTVPPPPQIWGSRPAVN